MHAAPLVALAVDRLFGEPAARAHPVVWMGAYCRWAGARLRAVRGHRAQVLAGALASAGGTLAAGTAAALVRRALRRLPRPLAALAEGAVLSALLSARLLEREVGAVERALATGGAVAGRRTVARLVSRDVATLDAVAVREAALESLAENASDSVVAPLWWYALAGLPGAAAYRFVNTADAMWGYRSARWEWRGKAAARADDLANWWPARLTALLLAPRTCAGAPGAVARAAARTPSPNAGWPMGALALRLGVRLGKAGVYTLHPAGRAPRPGETGQALASARRTALAAALLATVGARR